MERAGIKVGTKEVRQTSQKGGGWPYLTALLEARGLGFKSRPAPCDLRVLFLRLGVLSQMGAVIPPLGIFKHSI
jgi:hypothetical protein